MLLCMPYLAEREEQCHVAVHTLALQLLASLHAFPCGCQLDVHTLRLNACRNMTSSKMSDSRATREAHVQALMSK
jgi:hypothetical protein